MNDWPIWAFIICVMLIIFVASAPLWLACSQFNQEIKYLPEDEVCIRVYSEYTYKDIPARCLKYFSK